MTKIADLSDLVSVLSNAKITSLNSLSNLLTDGGAVAAESLYLHKDFRVTGGAGGASPVIGMPTSLWQYLGCPTTNGSSPAAFTNPTNATSGSMQQADPGGGRTKMIAALRANTPQPGMLVLYDRLLQMGGLSGTAAGAQNINGGASADVTRYTNGVGNQLYYEISTQIGATARTITAVYKDGAGATQTSLAVPFGGTRWREAQRMITASFAAGGSTIKGITSVTLSGSTVTAGDFAVVIGHPLAYIVVPTNSNCPFVFCPVTGGIPVIQTGACLALAWIPGNTTYSPMDLEMTSVEI